MGLSTAGEMRDEVYQIIGGERMSPARMLGIVNRAYAEIAGAIDFQGLLAEATVSTVVDQEAYSIPGSLVPVGIKSVASPDEGRLLMFKKPEHFLSLDNSKKGFPSLWAWYGDQLRLWKVPDDVYTLRVLYQHDPVALGVNDTTEIPAGWDQAIVAMAAHIALMTLGDHHLAHTWFEKAAVTLRTRKLDPERMGVSGQMGVEVAHSVDDVLRLGEQSE